MKKIIFVSTNKSAWGGSEYLWYYTAVKFSEMGYNVVVSVPKWKDFPEEINKLSAKKISVSLNTEIPGYKKFYNRFVHSSMQINYLTEGYRFLLKEKPELVIVNQGGNSGGIDLMEFCIKHKLRYVTISQAANEAKWPTDSLNKRLSDALQESLMNYYVSKANIKLTEIQTGKKIEKAKVVFNPFNVDYNIDLSYPPAGENYFLANVARHEFFAKGQDILFEALSDSKWKQRNLKVNLYGKGEHSHSMSKLKNFFQLDMVNICGHIPPAEIWKTNHALVLTSRYEGLPLALVEAMICARTAVCTKVSGIPEVLKDNQTGFLAKAPTAELVDEAMERAWQRRSEWQLMGEQAREEIRKIIPESPVDYFCNELKKFI